MTNIKELTTQTIALQHQNRLLEKKVDVVGVIATKVDQKMTQLSDKMSNNEDKLQQLDMEKLTTDSETLTSLVGQVSEKRQKSVEMLGSVVERVDEIDNFLIESKELAIDELNKQALVHKDQVQNISERVMVIQQGVEKHKEDTKLDSVEYEIQNINEEVQKFSTITEKSVTRVDHILNTVEKHLKQLNEDHQYFRNMQEESESLMTTIGETMERIDDKVCRVSPLYTAPKLEDIEESYQTLALSTDIEAVLGKALVTNEEVSIEPQMEPIVTESYHEELTDTIEQVLEPVEDVKPKKKGFFATIFGGN